MKLIPSITSTPEKRVLLLALASRVIALTLMTVADALFSDLDSSAHLQNFPCSGAASGQHRTHSTSLIDGLAPWDSVYFVRIAKCGYEFDMTNAFFPLLPLLMRYGAKLLHLLPLDFNTIPIESIYTLIGLLINLLAFLIAALALYRLSLVHLKSQHLAALSMVLFCCNPASVFYSAAYTEALFAACTWTGLLLLPSRFWIGILALTLASAARSNGILSIWFILHPLLLEMCRKRRILWIQTLKAGVGSVLVLGPYVAMQVVAYKTYCVAAQGSAAASEPPPWCTKKIPSVYAFVQDKYWDVGFLRFYKYPDRWPWFIQSSPVLFLAVSACWKWFYVDWKRAFSLGVLSSTPSSLKRRAAVAAPKDSLMTFFLTTSTASYIYHLAGMTAMAALVMHVNVATRFLSSCPALYWYAAVLLSDRFMHSTSAAAKGIIWKSDWIWLWTLISAVLGCILFPNFYPWT